MDWSGEDMHMEFMVFKTLTEMWLETKGVLDHKQYMFLLQLLGNKGLCYWELFPYVAPQNNDLEQPDHVQETFEGSFIQSFSF